MNKRAVISEGSNGRESMQETAATVIVAYGNVRVDVSGSIWRLSPDHALNWSLYPDIGPSVSLSLRMFIIQLIKTLAPDTVTGYFRGMQNCLKAAMSLGADVSDMSGFDIALVGKMRGYINDHVGEASVSWALHAYRKWYQWCSDAGLEGFDARIADALDEIVVGGSRKGDAVLSHDPKLGPLHTTEFDRLFLSLRNATVNRLLPDVDLAVAWLFLSFGCNPKNLQLLNDEDLLRTVMSDGTVRHELRIPRIKKQGVAKRGQFKTRPLRTELGELLERVVKANAGAKSIDMLGDTQFVPAMFRLDEPRRATAGVPDFAADSIRWSTAAFGEALRRVANRLDLYARDGSRLYLTPRRLRYTFATRLVQDGASQVLLADALDHTDLQHVMVYYNARADIVVKLDRAMAIKLAPWAQAFMGTLVKAESRAIRGHDPASRIRHFDSRTGRLDGVGTCGSFGFCGLAAPIACYTCTKFQPWLDGPHELVLEALLADRDAHLQQGADPKMTQARDLTITAVADVITRCEEMKRGG
ncbi:tyrosine-type recombinase/integrase [Burkholderia cenocepacia]|uniref:tyrosine-type recombinase/integrase n=1 Tax=Burkholderia cenocepacia TaxID=95486 RepID=UPI00265033D3|nr:tyrosine-type recombinase/integrase [Burkholderia cenocepacia]MDN7681640.1 tyrosine-type recombinase/integrase [Burkholderia cenocepacia]